MRPNVFTAFAAARGSRNSSEASARIDATGNP